jgi:hypothetical protein
MCLKLHAGVCDVAGFGDVYASPWPPGPPLVSRRGTVLYTVCDSVYCLPGAYVACFSTVASSKTT